MSSGENLLSEFFLRQVPTTINGVTLCADLIAMRDYNVILGMNFLGKHNAIINYSHPRVTFRPNDDEKFTFKGISLLYHKMIILAMQAQMMLSNECMGFLTSTVDKRKDEKLYPTKVPVVKDFVEVFPKE